MGVFEIQQLTRRYGARTGVESLNLDIPEGSLFGFLGPNGAGKTTTIRVLLGFLRPTEGSAHIFALDCWRDSPRIKADVGYVPGDLRLYPWLTCRDAVRIVGLARGRDLRQAGEELSEDFGLEPDVRVRKMSRGMRQKLGLILALVHRPRVLILDEPTTSLDPLMRQKLCQRLRDLAAAGHTVFFSSHTLSEVEELCDRVAILRDGRLVADETLVDLRARASRTVTIVWRQDANIAELRAPDCLEVHDRDQNQWHATLTGSSMDLVRWSAAQPIEDLAIGQPDLTTLFQQYYVEAQGDA